MAGKKQKGKMANPVPAACDKIWAAEQDARTLAEAKVIAADRKRVNAACAAAKRMAAEDMKRARSMEAVANKTKKG